MNAQRGDASLEIGGKKYLLCFKWQQLEELREWLGNEYLKEIASALESFDLTMQAKILEIGLRHYHGDLGITEKQIFEESPATREVDLAIGLAINRANYGAKGASDENPKMAERVKIAVKTIMKILFAKRSLWYIHLD